MKRCPTCQRTYTDDSLIFCLQDGTTLLSVSDATVSFDANATLRNIEPGSSDPPPTEIFRPQAAPTVASPMPAPSTTPHLRVDTSDVRDAVPPPRSSSKALLVGVISIVILLLAIVGIGVALLFQRGSVEENRNTAKVNSGNSTANEKSNGNANSSVNNNPTASNTNNSAPVANANSNESTPNAASRVEAKILKDIALTESDLAGLSLAELKRLRNTVYARHGRTFDTPELQRYFESRPWYRPRSDYSSQDLTPTDSNNIKLIQTAENGGM